MFSVITKTDSFDSPTKFASEVGSTEIIISEFWSPSLINSSTSASVITWGIFQLSLLKEIWDKSAITSVSSKGKIFILTSEFGLPSRTIVNVAFWVEASNNFPWTGLTVKPTTSSSFMLIL